jgi:hypothetical protein
MPIVCGHNENPPQKTYEVRVAWPQRKKVDTDITDLLSAGCLDDFSTGSFKTQLRVTPIAVAPSYIKERRRVGRYTKTNSTKEHRS